MNAYQYSIPAAEDDIASVGCFTTLPIRIHKEQHLAEDACCAIRTSCKDIPQNKLCKTSLAQSPVGHFAALAYAECIPERLACISMASDFACLADELYAYAATQQQSDEHIQNLFTPFKFPKGLISRIPTCMQLWAHFTVQWLELDEQNSLRAYRSAGKSIDAFKNGPADRMSLKEYIPLMTTHFGIIQVEQVISFGIGIRLTDGEKALVQHMIKPLQVSILLTNDYYSYPKAKARHQKHKKTGHVFNAMAVLMEERFVGEADAMTFLKWEILDAENVHNMAFDEALKHGSLSEKLTRYVKAFRLFVGGHSLWCAARYRYSIMNGVELQDSCPTVLANGVNNGTVAVEQPPREHLCNGHDARYSDPTSPDNLLKLQRVKPDNAIITAPYKYVSSLPSKGVRETFILALDAWFEVSLSKLKIITTVTSNLHDITLMLDDIEDDSPKRRQMPSTHTVFGKPQTINSANYMLLLNLKDVQQLSGPDSLAIFIDETENLNIGQSLDLNWKYCKHCPTIEEYMTMVDSKTGSLFSIAVRLMQANSTCKRYIPEITIFTTLLGRYFQIRDDLKNLDSDEYTEQKGFCEDLDEAKFSFPLIHCLSTPTPTSTSTSAFSFKSTSTASTTAHWRQPYEINNNTIIGILFNPPPGGLTTELKQFILNHMRNTTKSIAYTENVLKTMKAELLRLLETLREKTGVDNPLMKVLVRALD